MTTSHKLLHLIIRVPKEEAAFTYFILESHENLCFYSTMEESLGQGYRDIDIKADESLKDDTLNVIESLKAKFDLDILINEMIDDSRTST